MAWLPDSWGRTRSPRSASSVREKTWTRHDRHDEAGPHREVGPRKMSAVGWLGESPLTQEREPGNRLITLDGSRGEGGGQILRSALTLSLLTGKPFRLVKIRANRDKPGLRPQHLKAVETAALLGGAELVGASVGSRDLTFRPGLVEPRDLNVEIGTAGSTALILHTLNLVLAVRGQEASRLTIHGGTFNESAPSFPFLETTWSAYMKLLGLPISLGMPRAGYYPEGGGTLDAWIEPGQPQPLTFEDRGALVRIRGVAQTTNLPTSIARRMIDRVEARLAGPGLEAELTTAPLPGPGQGASISLVAEFENGPPATFVGLGKRGKTSEAVADEAVDPLLAHLDSPAGAVDEHSADQLLLPLSLAEGRSVYTVTRVTEHLRTNVETIRSFLDVAIRVEEFDDQPGGRVIVG